MLGMPAGTWPQGPWRCCAENGQVRLWLGMVILAARHLAATCEGTALMWGGREEGHGESCDSQSL